MIIFTFSTKERPKEYKEQTEVDFELFFSSVVFVIFVASSFNFNFHPTSHHQKTGEYENTDWTSTQRAQQKVFYWFSLNFLLSQPTQTPSLIQQHEQWKVQLSYFFIKNGFLWFLFINLLSTSREWWKWVCDCRSHEATHKKMLFMMLKEQLIISVKCFNK